ncbi:hypothetical protein ACFQL1_11760 [Halomicroarcula sp. GCM10025709]|uniref:hypothetical protein n=1 Tax=Halomicroarcula sp. GCM10025709 TaxID=3252669 RepID=UPI0036208576
MTGVPGAGPAGGRLSTDRLRSLLRRGGRWVFGDRYGLALWLGLALAFGLTWRVGFFIQDTYTTANTLVALSNGQLHVTEVRYSLSLGPLPGMHEVGGRLYGRNYGQLALALPFVWGLEAIAGVVDPGVLLPGLWALGGLAFVRTIAGLEWFDRDRTLTVGSVAVAALFVASLRAATDLDPTRLALVGYQLSTLLAAATLCLLLYRLVSLVHDRRAGLAAALVTGLATPVGFWATIPKRHTLVAAMTVGVVYAFAVSCHSEGRTALRARTGAYALAGLVTWTHAFEGFFLVVVLTGVDLLTGGSRRPRHLLLVGLVVLLALTPMLATNYAISGNPVEPRGCYRTPRPLTRAGRGRRAVARPTAEPRPRRHRVRAVGSPARRSRHVRSVQWRHWSASSTSSPGGRSSTGSASWASPTDWSISSSGAGGSTASATTSTGTRS